MEAPEPHNKLTREQKVGVTLLFVFAILTAGLAFLQMRNTLTAPFVLQTSNNSKKTLQDFQVDLQNVDTDKDGLSDFDEVQFHGTSAYLPDTDSDGKDDKSEVDAGTDPLCAEGATCQSATASGSITPPSIGTPIDTPLSALSRSLTEDEENSAAQNIQALNQLKQDPEKIRELLRQSGKISEEELVQLDDATLLKILEEIIQSAPPVSTSTTATSTEEGL